VISDLNDILTPDLIVFYLGLNVFDLSN